LRFLRRRNPRDPSQWSWMNRKALVGLLESYMDVALSMNWNIAKPQCAVSKEYSTVTIALP